MNRPRKEKESFEDYRKNLIEEDKENKMKLSGKYFHRSKVTVEYYPFTAGVTYRRSTGPNVKQ